ncbi:hypothetical protein CYMTET_34609, partial [Cymbomonas tetramitiformis]
VWHNVVLAFLCLMLSAALPRLLSPAYSTNAGMLVVGTREGFASAEALLPAGWVVTSISNCSTSNMQRWQSCLRDLMPSQRKPGRDGGSTGLDALGYWVPGEYVAEAEPCSHIDVDDVAQLGMDAAQHRCSSQRHPPSFICFALSDNIRAPAAAHHGVCLDAKRAARMTRCSANELKDRQDQQPRNVCVWPALPSGSLLVDFVVTQEGHMDALHRTYMGEPELLWQALHVSGYVPRPLLGLNAAGGGHMRHFLRRLVMLAPEVLESMVGYTYQVSAALAVLNAAPVRFLDGEAIIASTVNAAASEHFTLRTQRRVISAFTNVGTILFGAIAIRSALRANRVTG